MTIDLFKDFVPESSQTISTSSSENNKQPIEEQFQPEGIPASEFRRHVARTSARAVESGLGMVGQVSKAIPEYAMSRIYQLFTGQEPDEGAKEKFNQVSDYLMGLGKYLTPENIKQAHEKFTGEYLKPKTPGEEKFDEIVTDTTNTILPSLAFEGGAGLFKPLVRSALMVGSGQLAKKSTEYLGGDVPTQEKAKSIAMFLSSFARPSKAKEMEKEAFLKRDSSIPATVMGDARELEHSMNSLNSKMKLGTVAPSEKAILDETQDILNKIQQGKMSYQEAAASKRSINEKSQSFLYSTADKSAKARARKLYTKINNDLEKFISKSEQTHPEFYNAHKEANEISSAIFSSKKAANYIKDNSSKILAAGIVPKLTGILSIPQTIGAAGIGAATLKAGEILTRMYKSPILRKYYLKTLSSIVAENLPQTINNLKKLQKNIEKQDKDLYNELQD